jgi:hypothetical protein
MHHDCEKNLAELLQTVLIGDVPWSAELNFEIAILARAIDVAPCSLRRALRIGGIPRVAVECKTA